MKWPARLLPVKKTVQALKKKGYALADFIRSGAISESGQHVTPDSALKQVVVYSCVRVLSESIGMLPCKLYKEQGGRREIDSGHPLSRVLSIAPNDYMTAQEFWELVVIHLCLRGNFYAHKTRVGRQIELHPLAPESVTAKMDERRKLYYEVNTNGQTQTYTQKELWHVRLPSIDGINGLSPITQGLGAIGLNQSLNQYMSRFYTNGARPSGAITLPTVMDDEVIVRLSEQFNARHSGSANAGRPLILEGGMGWQPLSMTAHDAQLLESQKLNETQICGLFRVPPHMIASMEKMTLNNIEHMGMNFVNHSLVPYLTRIEKRIICGLLDEREQGHYYAKFNTAALMRGDLKSRYIAYNIGIHCGILNANECRANEDLNPREGGDDYLLPMNMQPINPKDDNDGQSLELPA